MRSKSKTVRSGVDARPSIPSAIVELRDPHGRFESAARRGRVPTVPTVARPFVWETDASPRATLCLLRPLIQIPAAAAYRMSAPLTALTARSSSVFCLL